MRLMQMRFWLGSQFRVTVADDITMALLCDVIPVSTVPGVGSVCLYIER